MSAQQGSKGAAPPPATLPQATLKDRFVAWWEGYDLAALLSRRPRADEEQSAGGALGGSARQSPQSATDRRTLNRSGKPLWTATRVQVAEKIWGDGYATPGGNEHIPTLVKPLGLNPAMSVLDLAAGLGGSTRSMASQFGAWVTGLESNPVLAEAGMFRSHKAGMARQAPIQPFDPETFSWPKRVDAVFAKEGFYTVRNKDGLLDAVEAALKPRGHFLFTDYVLDKAKASGPIFKGWLDHEPVEPHPWTVDQYAQGLQQRNLDIRITEDLSDLHRSLILTAIQGLVAHLEQHSMDHETKIAVVEEVELWARRVAVLDAGIRLYRFYVLKPADIS
ncbi:methyltransferase domain-containing protein [Nitrospirillum sp. BR 11163]|uniref:methyltransferase domain-containing protein n=1 Tax=Nitrospirillum sp. BR 11163 TaxID=3104323 RepID=UPI002AFE761D|nr:methyltransferase domain-containing protein [Nitrospirillum sp. BR 11163]MEA1676843.1 methyltransferase domain-containing protein [Nitrospirillum sp. BR 11163]